MKLVSFLTFALIGTILVTATNNDFLRDLQALPSPPPQVNSSIPKNETRPPKKYDENLKIPFKSDLGCGACIRGDYVYCIPGPEGSNST